VFATAATLTSTALYTPTTTLGTNRNITHSVPKDFPSIESTLPDGLGKRAGVPSSCFAATTITQVVPAPSEFTAARVTALTGGLLAIKPFSSTFDRNGLASLYSSFYATYTGYITVIASISQVMTTSYRTKVFRTVTLPVPTATATTSNY
jgi:hypothetical protein